jgi:hypothetical protein
MVQAPSQPKSAKLPAVTLAWQQASTQYFHLYAGKLYAGSVMRIVPENWREMGWFKAGVPDDASDFQKKSHPSLIKHHETNEAKPWRAWIMSDDEGEAIGTFATLDEAKGYLAGRVASSLTAPAPAGTDPVI